MTEREALKEYLEQSMAQNIALLIKKELEANLPEGVTVESSTDEQLGKALDKFKEEYGDDIEDD